MFSCFDISTLEVCSLPQRALRVIGVAGMGITLDIWEALQTTTSADARLAILKSTPATWVGLVGHTDPPKPGVKQAIQDCQTANVRVIIITGDQMSTTTAIAHKIGLTE